MKKIAAPNTKFAMKLASTAPSKRPFLKMLSTTTGAVARRSISTKSTSSTMAPPKMRARMLVE